MDYLTLGPVFSYTPQSSSSLGVLSVTLPVNARPASGLAPSMQAINTYLPVANVSASMVFLERAFGFTRGVVLAGTDGQPRYAEMRHGDAVVMLVPRGDASTPTGGAPDR